MSSAIYENPASGFRQYEHETSSKKLQARVLCTGAAARLSGRAPGARGHAERRPHARRAAVAAAHRQPHRVARKVPRGVVLEYPVLSCLHLPHWHLKENNTISFTQRRPDAPPPQPITDSLTHMHVKSLEVGFRGAFVHLHLPACAQVLQHKIMKNWHMVT